MYSKRRVNPGEAKAESLQSFVPYSEGVMSGGGHLVPAMDKIGPLVVDELHIINDLDARRLEQELHANLSCGADPVVTQTPFNRKLS